VRRARRPSVRGSPGDCAASASRLAVACVLCDRLAPPLEQSLVGLIPTWAHPILVLVSPGETKRICVPG